MRPAPARLLTQIMGLDGFKAPATVPPASTRKECCRSVAALLPFLLPVISLTINSVTDVAGFPSIMLISDAVLFSHPVHRVHPVKFKARFMANTGTVQTVS